jgi:hypothetical protein
MEQMGMDKMVLKLLEHLEVVDQEVVEQVQDKMEALDFQKVVLLLLQVMQVVQVII